MKYKCENCGISADTYQEAGEAEIRRVSAKPACVTVLDAHPYASCADPCSASAFMA